MQPILVLPSKTRADLAPSLEITLLAHSINPGVCNTVLYDNTTVENTAYQLATQVEEDPTKDIFVFGYDPVTYAIFTGLCEELQQIFERSDIIIRFYWLSEFQISLVGVTQNQPHKLPA